jgi:hypothetical protein
MKSLEHLCWPAVKVPNNAVSYRAIREQRANKRHDDNDPDGPVCPSSRPERQVQGRHIEWTDSNRSQRVERDEVLAEQAN